MTKFETILRLAEIKGFLCLRDGFPLIEEEITYNSIHAAINNLIEDLSEEFQEGLPDKNCPEYSIENEQYNFSEKSPFINEYSTVKQFQSKCECFKK